MFNMGSAPSLSDIAAVTKDGNGAAVPAFTVPNPYANYGFGCYCGSSNNGCC